MITQSEFECTRSSFYRKPEGGTALWLESSDPEHKHGSGHICCCTQEVTEKPDGVPFERKQELTLSGVCGNSYKFDLWIFNKCLRLQKSIDPNAFTFNRDPYDTARYNFYCYSPRNMHVEIARPGFGYVDSVLADVYVGYHDSSRWLNGHSPSKVVPAAQILEHTIWSYWSHGRGMEWGTEAVEIFTDRAETSFWKNLFFFWSELRRHVNVYVDNFDVPIEAIKARVESDAATKAVVEQLVSSVYEYIDKFNDSELLKFGVKYDQGKDANRK